MTDAPIALYPRLCRRVSVADVELQGSQLDAILVPWDTPTTVYDDPDEPGPYQEGFRRGAFDLQLQQFPTSVHDVALLPRHGASETFGTLRELRNEDEGLHATFGILPSRRADVAQMVADGVDSVSIEFHPLQRAPRRAGEIRWRDRAMLVAVAMVATPAYADARVLAVRAEQAAARAEADRLARMAQLDAELAELRAAGERWQRSV